MTTAELEKVLIALSVAYETMPPGRRSILRRWAGRLVGTGPRRWTISAAQRSENARKAINARWHGGNVIELKR